MTSGTTSTGLELVGLSAEEICAIITVCAKSRVSSLAYAGLSVNFAVATGQAQENAWPEHVDQSGEAETSLASGQVANGPVANIALSDEDKSLLEESRLAVLMVDSPLAYEQEMIDAQLSPRVVNGGGEDPRRTE